MTVHEQNPNNKQRTLREIVLEYMNRDPSLNDDEAWRLYNAEKFRLDPVRFADQSATAEADPETSSG